jgi:hypothetical protein
MLKVDEIIEILDKYTYLSLSDNDGSCPCGYLEISGIQIETHCWRTGSCCKYSGLHITNKNEEYYKADLKLVAETIIKQLKDIYSYTEWRIKFTPIGDVIK